MSTPLIEAMARAMPDRAGYVYRKQAARAALTAITEAGMVIVPREPTKAMVKAAADQVTYDIDSEQAVKFITPYAADTAYRTMISAAQRGEPKP